MLTASLLAVALLIAAVGAVPRPVHAQEMASYYDQARFLTAPASSFREGLLGVANPAVPHLAGDHLVAAWTSLPEDAASVQDWGVFASGGGIGGAVFRIREAPLALTGYHLSVSGGSDAAAVGVGYQGFTGDATALGRYNRMTFGTVLRPSPRLSLGVTGNVSLETDDREVVGALGVRPLGTSHLTLFADAAWGEGDPLADVPWSAGAAVELVRGIDVVGRYVDTGSFPSGVPGRITGGEGFGLGLRVEFGRGGVESQAQLDDDGAYVRQVNRIRSGSYTPSALADAIRSGGRRVEVDASDGVPYRSSRLGWLFGDASTRFYTVLRTLRQAADDDGVTEVAVRLPDGGIGPERAWEIRTEMRRAQQRGVRVVAFVERPGLTTYHLASVADAVVLDPQGTVQLPGYALSRTYLSGTLDKLGLGFQEWRFFEYKSALETFSRTEFSEADSLQRAQYLDDLYATMRQDVTASRGLSGDSLDRLVDERVVLTAREAREAALVDTLARWSDRDDLLPALTGRETRTLDADALHEITTATRRWGQKPQIAVVYGIGATSLDDGIEARTLSKQIRALADRDAVKAVVFRVDSPGGDGLAADLVAEAVRDVTEAKPVIVSQGQVAGSGGYWISMYADRIVAGPTTLTGSIGVAGGWVYDAGFSEKTGLSYDVVQRGERADLFSGYRLPLVGGPQIPTRKLTEDELERVESLFQQLYGEFVAKVAAGRDTTEAHIRDVGEGRIYSGLDGLDVGLVDEIGGLAQAIDTARQAAGLSRDAVEVVEVNPTTGFGGALARLLPGPLQRLVNADDDATPDDPAMAYLRVLLQNQPAPIVMLPPGTVPDDAR